MGPEYTLRYVFPKAGKNIAQIISLKQRFSNCTMPQKDLAGLMAIPHYTVWDGPPIIGIFNTFSNLMLLVHFINCENQRDEKKWGNAWRRASNILKASASGEYFSWSTKNKKNLGIYSKQEAPNFLCPDSSGDTGSQFS